MMGFLPIGFTAPAVLAALALLPVIWWLLRLTPPRPQRVSFPPTRLLAEIAKREETPSKSPWWLTLLRLILATLVILAVAGPLWRPVGPVAAGDGPLLLVVDNGWAASHDWPSRLVAAERALAEAEAAGRPVVLAATAEGPRQPLSPDTAAAARDRLGALDPRPWPSDREGLVAPLTDVLTATPPAVVVWLSDGLAGRDDGFADLLAGTGATVTVVEEATPSTIGLAGIDNGAEALDVAVRRLPSADAGTVTVAAHDLRGFLLGEATATFEPGSGAATARFELPGGLRNDIARLDVAASETAGAVRLVDERWRRRTVGLISGANADQAQPLLSPLHYLSRALAPFADLREPAGTDIADTVKRLVDEGVSIIVLADVGTLVGEAREEIEQWVENGGVLVRFAGPRLAEGGDDLVPVRLRTGGRVLGGSLSWEEPQPLASFSPEGPFAGLPVPDDVTVNRQVLAEPDANLAQRTWASLGDGTPLVTAAPLGDGTIVLFHVTADTSWSNLPLSGGFVEMLRRLVALSSAAGETAGTAAVPLQPMRVLDGEGRFTAPGPEVEPLSPGAPLAGDVGPTRPPGLYGADDSFRAVNLLADDAVLAPLALGPLAGTATRIGYAVDGPIDLKPFLLTAAMLLLIADAIAVLILSGGLRFRRSSVAALAAGAVLAAALGVADPARAQTADADAFAMEAANETRLAYVTTGDAAVDEASRLGLAGLSRFLAERTALEPAEPLGVDPGRDELAFFPLLYWPLTEGQAKPSPQAMARVDAYMKNGGTILFDTRDQLTTGGFGGVGPATLKLREILDGLDIPPLEPVPADHVLTKAFYLLEEFPGRWSGGPLWVEASASEAGEGRPVRAGDGVSPMLITANDFAGAWAVSDAGDWLYPTVPADPFQREFALRAGINIVMYALTGNYKADQVHVPALLERLGQ